MTQKIKLYDHQQKIVDLNPQKYLLAHSPGTGKTFTSLALCKKNNTTPLIIVPKCIREKWKDEMKMMGVKGTVVGRERFRLDYQKIPPHESIIVDECHHGFANHQSQAWKALMGYIKRHNVKYIWLLSGTPYSSSPWNIYSLAKLIGHNWPYQKFRERFFDIRYLGNRVIWEPRDGIKDEIRAMVHKIGDTCSLQDCFDVPDQTIDVVNFTLTKEQQKGINKLKIEEADPVVRVIKSHQIASGTLKGNEFADDQVFKCDKNDYIVELAADQQKMVVFSRYNAHLNVLADLLTKKKIPNMVINGKTDDKEALFNQAEKADRMVVLVNSMVSVGYELPSFDLMVFACLSFSYVDYDQARHRILRANALKKNVYKILLTKNTVDVSVYGKVKLKQKFSEHIYAQEIEQTGSENADDFQTLPSEPVEWG